MRRLLLDFGLEVSISSFWVEWLSNENSSQGEEPSSYGHDD